MKLDDLVKQRFNELEQQSLGMIFSDHNGRRSVNHEKFQKWATSVLNLLQRAFGNDAAHYINFSHHYQSFGGWEYQYQDCLGIFRAAKEDYEGGYLFNLRSLITAEILSDDIMDQAKELVATGYKDPACVLAGISLEVTIKELCTKSGIPHNKLDKMNTDLCKAGIYNMAKQKQITAWADLRNKAAHGDWSAYNQTDVEFFIEGVESFVADFL